MGWHPLGRPVKTNVKLPPGDVQKKVWISNIISGKWESVRVVLTALHGKKSGGLRHLMHYQLTRFHECEAVTNRMGITERGMDDRGIIYCRLTDFGHELSRVWFSKSAQKRWKEEKKKLPQERIIDVIFRGQ